ncbi:NAD(P)-dependent alcohol dehydrogenase [Luedemannella flava]
MRAVQFTEYGAPAVLRMVTREKPTPRDDQVLIRIRATTVTSAECGMRRGEPAWGRPIIGLRRPRPRYRTLGNELAGDIEAVGAAVRRFRPGDQVFGFAGFNPGANADYLCLPESASIEIKPANLSYEDSAAAVDGATTALYFLRGRADVQPGQRVLVIGAAGSIGTYAVQLAKRFGAHVTGVCSTRNVELVRSLGADEVVDYTREDFTTAGATYDVIFDTVGKSSFRRCRPALTRTGLYLPTTGLANAFLMAATSFTRGPQVRTGMSVRKNDALVFIRGLLEADELRVVVDRRYPLERIAEAHEYVDTGRKVGNVVITMDQG